MAEGKTNQIRLRLFLFGALSLGIMFMIFVLSAKSGAASTTQSRSFMNTWLGSWLVRNAPMLFPGDAEMQLRKYAHMFEYCCLAGSCLLFFDELLRHGKRRLCPAAGLALGWSLIYAVSDEFHQTFVPGRTGRASDVVVDLAGAAIGAFTILLVLATGRAAPKMIRRNRK